MIVIELVLKAYAAFQTHDAAMKKKLWNDLFARVGGSKCSLKVKTLLPPVVPAPLDESDGLTRMMFLFGVLMRFICKK